MEKSVRKRTQNVRFRTLNTISDHQTLQHIYIIPSFFYL